MDMDHGHEGAWADQSSDRSEGECSDNEMSPEDVYSYKTPSLSRMISNAQDTQNESDSSIFTTPPPVTDFQFKSVNRKRYKKRQRSDSASSKEADKQTKRTSNDTYYDAREEQRQIGPKIVIISSPDTNLAKMSPIKLANVLKGVGNNSIHRVNKVTNGIAVHCYNSAQALKIKQLSSLGEWSIKVEFPKSEVQSRGVIRGMSLDVSDEEILECCKSKGVVAVRRLKRKMEGKWVDCQAVCLTFSKKVLPSEIVIGFEVYRVRPYVDQVVRCFQCQRIGHMAKSCKGSVRCVRCGEGHKVEECPESNKIKCCRCGENHSAAYEGCKVIKIAKEVNSVKARYGMSYAEATKMVNEAPYIRPKENQHRNTKINQNMQRHEEQDSQIIEQTSEEKTITKIPSQAVKKTITVSDAATQTTGNEASCQTDSFESCKCSNKAPMSQQIVWLVSGVLEVYENTKNKKERNQALDALIQKHAKAEQGLRQYNKVKDRKSSASDTDSQRKKTHNEPKQTKQKSHVAHEVPGQSFSFKSLEMTRGELEPVKRKGTSSWVNSR